MVQQNILEEKFILQTHIYFKKQKICLIDVNKYRKHKFLLIDIIPPK